MPGICGVSCTRFALDVGIVRRLMPLPVQAPPQRRTRARQGKDDAERDEHAGASVILGAVGATGGAIGFSSISFLQVSGAR